MTDHARAHLSQLCIRQTLQSPVSRNTESACSIATLNEPLRSLAANFLLLRNRLIAFMGRIFHHAVVHGRTIFHRFLFRLRAASAEVFKGHAELLGHEVVNDGVDGTVGVDAHPAEEQEPGVVVRWVNERVDHH